MQEQLYISRLNISYEDVLKQNNLSSSTVIMLHNHSMLFGWNTWRKQWELPSGHIEDGELPNQTAIREVNEEVHYSLGQIKYVDSFSVKSSADTNERVRVVFVACISDVEQDAFTYDPNNDENDKLEWITLQDVSNKKNIDYADTLILKSLKNIVS